MASLIATVLAFACLHSALARPFDQLPLTPHILDAQPPKTGFNPAEKSKFGQSHLSEWCALSKDHFLEDLKKGDAGEWIFVMGNEAGGAFHRPPTLFAVPSAISL